jgi:5'-3' exonuclease
MNPPPKSPDYHHVIFDGHNLLFRAYHTVPNPTPTNVSNRVLAMVKKVINEFAIESDIYFAWDLKKGPDRSIKSFRKNLLEHYKNRDSDPEVIRIIGETCELLVEWVEKAGFINLFPRYLEADDVIAHWCKKMREIDKKVLIISNDKDLYQLCEHGVDLYVSKGKNNLRINCTTFERIVGIDASHYLTWKAIQGDKSDLISGIYGYGPVKAKRLIENYSQDYSAILTPDQIDILDKNLKLMDLSKGMHIQEGEYDYMEKQFNDARSNHIFEEYEQFIITKGLTDILQLIKKKRYDEESNGELLNDWFGDLLAEPDPIS